jgi:hypothetical protein
MEWVPLRPGSSAQQNLNLSRLVGLLFLRLKLFQLVRWPQKAPHNVGTEQFAQHTPRALSPRLRKGDKNTEGHPWIRNMNEALIDFHLFVSRPSPRNHNRIQISQVRTAQPMPNQTNRPRSAADDLE